MIKKRSEERYEEMKKKNEESEKKIGELQSKMLEMKNQLENVQKENKKITDILGKIQMRDSSKNYLRLFENIQKMKIQQKLKKIKKNGNLLLKE